MTQDMNSSKPQYGYFLLADISGFSSYLARVELEHAGGILQKLLEGVARNIEPVFHVQDFHIDSVFAFVREAGIHRFENLYKLVEDTYVGFQGNLTEISNHITCNCAACRDVTALDLKFMIHYGEYILSSVQNKSVLYGLDPTFVRNRSWKEAVSVSVDWRGYVLFTEPCLTNLHVPADKYQGEKFFQDPISMFGSELKSNVS
ncbi:MAG TPA: DUF2652 domain-containing protein [Anaerolineales bacterium]|jgi:hypothetical protein|nr:DUF2652 domain-containing protein [Anaerolineales bacterium]HMZ06218.1 DUF2652 domain-containing protein [Anaerolineales bacterium]HNA88851.1 DUF2652 domain-containing protein [Anaerolineales bacterium]HNB34641.1 DUF2652 domain-containing protein [Anaerolineales bacterium]HNC07302.1 DUF2652 domain-containing protein [Anaerolineales bacterium]